MGSLANVFGITDRPSRSAQMTLVSFQAHTFNYSEDTADWISFAPSRKLTNYIYQSLKMELTGYVSKEAWRGGQRPCIC
jgi:hypothetical protein